MKTMDSLKVLVCGSVDEGKSTFLGRLFWDMNALKTDQVLALQKTSANRATVNSQNSNDVDFSFLSDGLRAERDQKITIDLAFRYFKYEDRQFIFIDAPGHAEYLPAMASGAYECDVALVVVDVTKKHIEPQTLKHILILNFFKVKKIFFVINKMDAVDFNPDVFEIKKTQIQSLLKNNLYAFDQEEYIAVSALTGLGITSNIGPCVDQSPCVFERLHSYQKPVDHSAAEGSAAVAQVSFISNQRIYCESIFGQYSPIPKMSVHHSTSHFSFESKSDVKFNLKQLLVQNSNSEIGCSDQILIKGLMLNTFSADQIIFKSEFLECQCRLSDYKVVNDLFFEAQIRLPQKTYYSDFDVSKRLGSALLIDPVSQQTFSVCILKMQ